MRVWSVLGEALESPLGMAVAGVAIVWAALPTIKKATRPLAVSAVKGVLALSDQAAEAGRSVTEGWRSIVAEATATPAAVTSAADPTATAATASDQYGEAAPANPPSSAHVGGPKRMSPSVQAPD